MASRLWLVFILSILCVHGLAKINLSDLPHSYKHFKIEAEETTVDAETESSTYDETASSTDPDEDDQSKRSTHRVSGRLAEQESSTFYDTFTETTESGLTTTTTTELSVKAEYFPAHMNTGIAVTDSLLSAQDVEDGALDMMVDWFTPIWNAEHADEEWLAMITTKNNYLYNPHCSKLGYINFLYRSTSFEMRQSIRRYVSIRMAREIRFGGEDTEPVLKWLSQNFVIPFKPKPRDLSSKNLPNLIQVYFPVGRPCTEDSKDCAAALANLLAEAKKYGDIIIGDYPDASETQGVKFMSALDWLNDCRESYGSNWQWVVKVESMIVANVPNIAYFLRKQDSEFLSLMAKKGQSKISDLTATLPLKKYNEKILNKVMWWGGRLMENVEVVKTPRDHPNAEANYHEPIYPPYTSKRFTMLNKRVVAEIVPRYKSGQIVYRNEDSLIAIIVESMNDQYGIHLRPKQIRGVATAHTSQVIHLLCGDAYRSSDDTISSGRNIVDSIIKCDCSTWLAYPTDEANDRREVTRELSLTCPFYDEFYPGNVYWQRK